MVQEKDEKAGREHEKGSNGFGREKKGTVQEKQRKSIYFLLLLPLKFSDTPPLCMCRLQTEQLSERRQEGRLSVVVGEGQKYSEIPIWESGVKSTATILLQHRMYNMKFHWSCWVPSSVVILYKPVHFSSSDNFSRLSLALITVVTSKSFLDFGPHLCRCRGTMMQSTVRHMPE